MRRTLLKQVLMEYTADRKTMSLTDCVLEYPDDVLEELLG